MKKINLLRVFLFSLAALWMLMIFLMSAQNATQSSNASGSVIESTLNIVDPDFKEKPQAEKSEIIASYQKFVRKSAHFASYGVLAILLILPIRTYNIRDIHSFIISLLCSALYATSDEIHQLFVPGRSGEVLDVLIDTCGALFGLGVFFLGMMIIKGHKERKIPKQ